MAERKPLPKILQRDKAFTAKLEVSAEKRAAALSSATPAPAPLVQIEDKPETPAPAPLVQIEDKPETPALAPALIRPRGRPRSETPRGAGEGDKMRANVAVSLSPEAAVRAEAWAAKGKVSVSTLLRSIASRVTDDIVAEWMRSGLPAEGDTVRHGRHSTSVYVTVPAEFGKAIEAERDPLGLLGLARAIGPVYRDAFEVAFIAEAQLAGF